MKKVIIKYKAKNPKILIIRSRIEGDPYREVSCDIGTKFFVGKLDYNGGLPPDVAEYLIQNYSDFFVTEEIEVTPEDEFKNRIEILSRQFANYPIDFTLIFQSLADGYSNIPEPEFTVVKKEDKDLKSKKKKILQKETKYI